MPPRRRRRPRLPAPPVSTGQGGQRGGQQFEGLHPRDANGVFTAGADANHGPARDGSPRQGDTGPRVAGLQRLLNGLGFGQGLAEDGAMGPASVAALVRAQRELGVVGEDGILGPLTRAALRARRDNTAAAGPRRRLRAIGRTADRAVTMFATGTVGHGGPRRRTVTPAAPPVGHPATTDAQLAAELDALRLTPAQRARVDAILARPGV